MSINKRKDIRRKYARVPLSGEAILSNSSNPTIKASIIDISQGGLALGSFSGEVSTAEYQVEIFTESGERIEFSVKLVRVVDSIVGFIACFRILQIDQKNQEIIQNLVFEYQNTCFEFIKQLDECNLLDDKVVDEEGNELKITFEKGFNSNT